jgi:outer membrane lipoprotein-sorting protein
MADSMFNRSAIAQSMIVLTVAVAAAAAAAAVRNTGKPSSEQATPSARQVLRRVLAAEERVPYSGRQTAVVTSGGRADATVTDEVSLGNSRSRIVYLLPPSAKGRTTIRDGRKRYTIEPSKRRIIVSEILHRPVSEQSAAAIASQVARSYNMSLERAINRRRPTFILTLKPKQGDRPTRKWWVDEQSGMVTRRESYALDGSLAEVSAFTNLQIGGRLDAHATVAHLPKGYTKVERPADLAVTDIDSARRLDPAAGDIPASLGGGFEFQSARVVNAEGTRSLLVQYSDGLAGFTLFRIPGRPKVLASAGAKSVTIGASTGTMAESVAPYRVLTWQIAGATYNLVSDISEETMIALARTVRF